MRAAAVALLLALHPARALAHGNPVGEAKATVAGKAVTVQYGRPALRGRDLDALLPPDHMWRMGADIPTTLTTGAELRFGSLTVKPGSYHLLGKKTATGEWRLMVVTPTTRWVIDLPRPYRVSDVEVVAEVPLAVSTLTEPVELMTIELAGERHRGEFALRWGTMSLKASFMGW
jgi:hypothetical protein